MKRFTTLLVSSLFAACATHVALRALAAPASEPGAGAPSAASVVTRMSERGEPAGTNFLPDSAILARVNDRIVRVSNFRDLYFSSDYQYRPRTDSAGRAEFLNSIVNKEILGLTAQEVGRPLEFADRAVLREHTNTVLSNALFDRLIGDSVKVSDAEAESAYAQFSWEYHLRHILFAERATAERVRRELVAGRQSWEVAVRMYSIATDDPGANGDLGWRRRSETQGEYALKTFSLQPGEISEAIQDGDGFHLVQALERRPVDPVAFVGVKVAIKRDIRETKVSPRLKRLYDDLRAGAQVVYDTANIRFTVAYYRQEQSKWPKPASGVINLSGRLVTFSPADTGRVLASNPIRRFTIGDLTYEMSQITPMHRPRIRGFEGLRYVLDSILLKPSMVDRARALGLEQHPESAELIERRREKFLVEYLYQDSIMSRVHVQPEQRRKYYQDHVNEFVSRPKVQCVRYITRSEAAADSLVAALRTGTDPRSLLGSHPERGIVKAEIKDFYRENAGPDNDLLFEELRPGQSARGTTDGEGRSHVYHVLSYHGERQMKYEEVESIVDESVQNILAERELNAFIARHRKKFNIESHPERVMRIKLTDPMSDTF